MTKHLPAALFIIGLLLCESSVPAVCGTVRFSRSLPTFFLEDDLAYARYLCLEPAGTYRQIQTGFGFPREVDRGTWKQPADGEVVLSPTNGALTFRAVSAGPLLLLLTTQAQIDSAAGFVRAASSLLQEYQDAVFARHVVTDIEAQTGARIVLQGDADSFERGDLEKLLGHLSIWMQSRATGTVIFDVFTEGSGRVLMAQRGAVFTRENIPAVRRTYQVARGAAPPFYFAKIDQRAFQTRVPQWTPFENLGGTHLPNEPVPSAR